MSVSVDIRIENYVLRDNIGQSETIHIGHLYYLLNNNNNNNNELYTCSCVLSCVQSVWITNSIYCITKVYYS